MIFNHYKSRHPKLTAKYITSFFQSHGFDLKYLTTFKTEIGSYSSHYELWYEGNLISTSNGKGITKDLSIASGLAEMYERFCNFGANGLGIMNPTFMAEYKKINPVLPKDDDIFKSEAFLIFAASHLPAGKE